MTRLNITALTLLVICVTLTLGWSAQAQSSIPTNAPFAPGTPTPVGRNYQTPTPTPTNWNRVKQCNLPTYQCRFIPGIVGSYLFDHRPITVTGRLWSLKTGRPLPFFTIKWIDVYCNFLGQCAFVYSTAESPSTITDADGYFEKTFTPLTYWGIMTMVGYLDGAGGLSYYQVMLPVYPMDDPNLSVLNLGDIYTKLGPIQQDRKENIELMPDGVKLTIKD